MVLWSNKVGDSCTPTNGRPGDDVDNDCDGEVDEDVCTPEDLRTLRYISFDKLTSWQKNAR